MEDNFSMDGRGDGSGSHESNEGDGAVMGVTGSDGEWQMKLHSISCLSPPAVQPSS